MGDYHPSLRDLTLIREINQPEPLIKGLSSSGLLPIASFRHAFMMIKEPGFSEIDFQTLGRPGIWEFLSIFFCPIY
jgi:hypothetical protein